MLKIQIISKNDTLRAIVNAAITKLTGKDYLDITVIKDLAKLTKVTLSEETKTILSLLHCVDYKKMEPAVLKWLNSLLTEIVKDI